MTKSAKWYIKFPLDAYALGPVDFKRPVGERKVREWARSFEGVKRVPYGFQCWPA